MAEAMRESLSSWENLRTDAEEYRELTGERALGSNEAPRTQTAYVT
jgi:hypothetical protein